MTLMGRSLFTPILAGLFFLLLSTLPQKAEAAKISHQKLNLRLVSAIENNDTQKVLQYLNHCSEREPQFDFLAQVGEKQDQTLLSLAAQKGNVKIVEAVLKCSTHYPYSLTIDQQIDRLGSSPLSLAAYYGHSKVTELLISHGAQVNYANSEGITPLFGAVLNGHTSVVRNLISSGADINHISKQGFSPLYSAAFNGRLEIAQLLIEHGADVNQISKQGFTPIYIAAHKGHSEIVRLLIQHGAQTHYNSKTKLSLFVFAQMGRLGKTVQILREEFSKPWTRKYFPALTFESFDIENSNNNENKIKISPLIQLQHQAALTHLRNRLRKNFISTSLFDLAKDYESSLAIIRDFNSRAIPSETYKINTQYLYADPYLKSHSDDIHQIYPNEISDHELTGILISLRHSISHEPSLIKDLNKIFDKLVISSSNSAEMARVKQGVRKRIKRLYEYALINTESDGFSDTNPLSQLALKLAENSDRCIDGLQDGLVSIESSIHKASAHSAGEFISQVLADYRMSFIEKHSQLCLDPEFQTTAPQILRQRMLYALGLRGFESHIAYPALGLYEDPSLQPATIMKRFLEGGSAELTEKQCRYPKDLIQFEPYDVQKMLELLHASRERAWVTADGKLKNPGALGKKMTNEILQEICLADPILREAYYDAFGEGEGIHPNAFFTPAPAGENETNFGLTDQFWLFLLENQGYILRTP